MEDINRERQLFEEQLKHQQDEKMRKLESDMLR
jgi:hypothetical protein